MVAPAGTDARGDIPAAARGQFASKAYQGASLRGIARQPGVDPALVHHYFAVKADLFLRAVLTGPPLATAEFQAEDVVADLRDGPSAAARNGTSRSRPRRTGSDPRRWPTSSVRALTLFAVVVFGSAVAATRERLAEWTRTPPSRSGL
ncbi:MAG TPA: helix-turn-helix domain-containing protein [Dermatophilaceae bacterium]|nr:helix-turn-helix domain-containing protein [Dermatophilaceae bacterium]